MTAAGVSGLLVRNVQVLHDEHGKRLMERAPISTHGPEPMEEYLPYYTQLFGIGLLWTTFHCAGMCGPIVAGVVSTCPNEGSATRRVVKNSGRVLAYQLGRLTTYLILGGLAGWLGSVAEEAIDGWTKVAGTALAAALIGVGIYQVIGILGHRAPGKGKSAQAGGKLLGKLLRQVNRRLPKHHTLRMLAFGAMMGLLPCMLMFWVLGLSASTASPLHGALIMGGLVLLTTPVLIFSAAAAGLARPLFKRLGHYFVPGAMIVSGVWMGMMAAASNGWIEHAHVMFKLFGEPFTIMLW
jgi:sulfite exporter TauE/SafE